MATRAEITKQRERVWLDVRTVNAQAHQKLKTLVSSQGVYTFYNIIDTHPYSALAKLVDDMQAQFKLLAESALAIEIDGVRVGVEADRIAANLIAKNQPPNVEIDLLRILTAVSTASVDVHILQKSSSKQVLSHSKLNQRAVWLRQKSNC
jgi:hypothetical protein